MEKPPTPPAMIVFPRPDKGVKREKLLIQCTLKQGLFCWIFFKEQATAHKAKTNRVLCDSSSIKM